MAKKSNDGVLELNLLLAHIHIRSEDLGGVVGLLLENNKFQEPLKVISPDWSITNTPFYRECIGLRGKNDKLVLENLREVEKEVKKLADTYRRRQNSGLILVLGNDYAQKSLNKLGFLSANLGYLHPKEVFDFMDNPGPAEVRKSQERELYINGIVNRIVQQDPSLVISPFFERVDLKYRPRQTSVYSPEGPKLYIKLVQSQSSANFIGLVDSVDTHWAYIQRAWDGIGAASVINKGGNLTEKVKEVLDVR